MKSKLNFSGLILLLLLSACRKEEFQKEGDFFYLNNVGAVMPVWVKGNTDSGKFIILLHGGPEGGSSQYYSIFPSHKKIEEHFAIVYWDQRMCGMSQGNPSMSDATLAQFTDDLDKLISLINFRYNTPQLYLMGHSWGGALGTNYLLEHQNKISGWIEIDGGHSWTTANAISRDSMMVYAEKKIMTNTDKDYWQFALDWYNNHTVVGINDNAHYSFVGQANGYDFNPESDSLQIPFTDLLFFSPISTAYFFVPYKFSFLNNGLDLQDQIHKITIPALICWGRHDRVFPVAIANDTYNRLGTADGDKYLHIFEISAHSPNYEQPVEFANEVIEFVNRY
ncbi:MAG: alpha/beta hydrolase [Bacteroidales bacterium]|jgi:pimeloyl-ACP methyl ester carboxylesterase|nr:alpha/beta hydrolase [Bacteroidales bacterium]